MTDRILQFYKRKKRACKRKIDRLLIRFTMHNRMITEAFYQERSPKIGRFRRGVYLFLLCLASKVGNVYSHRAAPEERRDYTNRVFCYSPESRRHRRLTYTTMAKKMLLCDVISFDIFDTLLLRPFDNPKTVFFLVGEKLHCPSFTRYRVLAEKQARQEAMEKNGTNEVTLCDIYQKMQRYVACDIRRAMELEEETELSLLQANPYMKQLYQTAVELGKTVIAVSDMYLSSQVIEKALVQNGYTQLSRIFISQECGFSKRSGQLFPYVREQLGTEKRYFHIGDNYTADFLRA